VVRLSALTTDRLYLPEDIPGTHFCYRLSRLQGYSAAEKFISKKNSTDTIGKRTRDLPDCSTVHQPTAPALFQVYMLYVRGSKAAAAAAWSNHSSPSSAKVGNDRAEQLLPTYKLIFKTLLILILNLILISHCHSSMQWISGDLPHQLRLSPALSGSGSLCGTAPPSVCTVHPRMVEEYWALTLRGQGKYSQSCDVYHKSHVDYPWYWSWVSMAKGHRVTALTACAVGQWL
jgi:hypothetical protein